MIYPDLENMYADALEKKVIGEDLGEYEGNKLKGLEPFWHDMKKLGRKHAKET